MPEGRFKRCHLHSMRFQSPSVIVVPMPRPALQHQLPLLPPLNAICVVLPREARTSVSSSSSPTTSDTPPDPSGPLRGCSPQTLTTRALLCHLSPTRKPCLSDTGQLGTARSGLSVSGVKKDRVKKKNKRRKMSKVPLSVRGICQRWGVVVSLSGRDKAKVWEWSIFRGIYQE